MRRRIHEKAIEKKENVVEPITAYVVTVKTGKSVLRDRDIPDRVIARITKEPKLPPIIVEWSPLAPDYEFVGSVIHTCYIEYDEFKRNDKFKKEIKNNSNKVTYDLGSTVLGGKWRASVSGKIRKKGGGPITPYESVGEEFVDSIRGYNPSKSEIKKRLGSIELQVISYKESRFRQFETDGKREGLPMYGPPNGFGVMMIDSPVPATPRQVWDWKDNVDAGKALYKT